MRVNMGRKGTSSSSLSANGGAMLGPLILANGPSQPLEAATKYYVDTVFSSLNANNVLGGVLPISSLPAFTGDVTSSQGSNFLTLTNLGVTPGSYAKVIVDTKGRITGNDILVGSDIPNFDWNKVTGKPNTLSGYGVTDALSTAGDALTGYLSVSNPTQAMSVINKQYVDSALNNNTSVVGDIIRKSYATTPSGFLRCNGGEIDKIIYADLYSVIGDNFSVTSLAGSGKPWQQQYQINTTQTGDITGWVAGTALPGILTESSVIVTKNRVYLLGGINDAASVSTVYTASINSDGTLGSWTTGTALPSVVSYSQAVVIKNRVYICGGYIAGGAALASVYTAAINSDGTLGAWSVGPVLPGVSVASSVLVTKTKVYLLGGSDGTTNYSTVYMATINSDGTIDAWTTGTDLPVNLSYSSVIVTKNRVYLAGGKSGLAYISTIYTAAINADGTLGTWTSGTALPGPLGISQTVVTKNRVYLLGGNVSGTVTALVYTAPINVDGTLGTWTTGTSLPGPTSISQVITTNSKIYLLGRYNGTSHSGAVYVASFNGGLNDYSGYYDGTISPLEPIDQSTVFSLPDFSAKEKNGSYIYIKH